MVNQQKRVEQETAYSAVVYSEWSYVAIPIPTYIMLSCPFLGQKQYRDGIDHSLQLHYRLFHVT